MRVGVGISRIEDVEPAAREAAIRALAAAGLPRAGTLFVAATVEHLDQAEQLCEALRRVAGPEARIVGGAAAAVLVPGDAEAEQGIALGVLALEERLEPFALERDGSGLPAAPGEGLGLVFVDPAAPLARVIGTLRSGAPGVRFAGGGVVTEGGLLLEDELAGAHAVGLIVPGPCRIAVAQSHQPVGAPLLVTRAEGLSILELDGQPAVESLARLSELPGLSEESLRFLALGVAPSPGEPFSPDDFVTVPLLGVDDERGSIELGAQVSDGTAVSFTLRDGMGARRSLQSALQRAGSARPGFGVYFDCSSRGGELHGMPGLDVSLIGKQLGAFPLLALRTAFELGPAGGKLSQHLFTGVLALAR